jgi:glycerol-3-phosphate dehydrogenase
VGVEMPICKQIYKVLYEEKEAGAAVLELMERELRHELEPDGLETSKQG